MKARSGNYTRDQATSVKSVSRAMVAPSAQTTLSLLWSSSTSGSGNNNNNARNKETQEGKNGVNPPSLPLGTKETTHTHARTHSHRRTRDPPQDKKQHVQEEPAVVARAHAVPDPRAVVVERPHATAAVPAVPRPQRPLDRARVARRAGHGAGAALHPHEARRGVLDVEVAVVVGGVAVVSSPHEAGGSLPLLAREDAYSPVERRGHLGIGGVHEPQETDKKKKEVRYSRTTKIKRQVCTARGTSCLVCAGRD